MLHAFPFLFFRSLLQNLDMSYFAVNVDVSPYRVAAYLGCYNVGKPSEPFILKFSALLARTQVFNGDNFLFTDNFNYRVCNSQQDLSLLFIIFVLARFCQYNRSDRTVSY